LERGQALETKITSALVDIGGRRLATRTAGEGTPIVVLEMGLGSPGSWYEPIARQIAADTRVVWYDRAGLGESDPAPTPRTIENLVLDLHTLLVSAGLPGPLVLAGHSMGGAMVRLYREQYPEQVVGLVLFDASHEDQRERYLALLPPRQQQESPALVQLRQVLEVQWTDPAANEEHIDNLATSDLLRTCRGLGDLPLVIVSRGRPSQDPANYPPGLIEGMEHAWQQMQRELTLLSSQSWQIIASKSRHVINEDEPEVLVEAIQRMVMLVRAQRRH
jgi:pimeloyl-ACP methyl ester carboxylesterase